MFRWVDMLRQKKSAQSRATFLRDTWATNSPVPYFTQSALLDRYIHRADPATDLVGLACVLDVLRTRPDLRRYFFRQMPNPAWASILWKEGFLVTPPDYVKIDDTHYTVQSWDVQDYVTDVAADVPDIVVQHLQNIPSDEYYAMRAFKAAKKIPVTALVSVLPHIRQWVANTPFIMVALAALQELIVHLADAGYVAEATDLFETLTMPQVLPLPTDAPQGMYSKSESKFRETWFDEKVLREGIKALRQFDAAKLVELLERQLRRALRLEAEARNWPDYEKYAGWRSSIEDSGQDLDHEYKDQLLRALRDVLEAWVATDPKTAELTIQRYLDESRIIFKRLGLHILQKFPTDYPSLLVRELLNGIHLNNTHIHHEFFRLLQNGCPALSPANQQALLDNILAGPAEEDGRRLAEWVRDTQWPNLDVDDYAARHPKYWKRDRLWMIREHLDASTHSMLDDLIAEVGAVDHPDFTSWTSGAFTVGDVSPRSEEELDQLSPAELITYIQQWQPPANQRFSPAMLSHQGLAQAVARVVCGQLDKYAPVLAQLLAAQPSYAVPILSEAIKSEQITDNDWAIWVTLCEGLVANGTDERLQSAMCRLLAAGLEENNQSAPAALLPRIRDLLLALNDNGAVANTQSFSNDPVTAALNHSHTQALDALIVYAWRRFVISGGDLNTLPDPTQSHIEPVIQDVLVRNLDFGDPVRHAVIGQRVYLLYWLDVTWLTANLSRIFPNANDPQSIALFVATWEPFIIFNRPQRTIPPIFKTVVERAIRDIAGRHGTRHSRDAQQWLAGQAVTEYLYANYDIASPKGQDSLIAQIFTYAPSEVHGHAAWILWRAANDNQADIEKFWPRIYALLSWRLAMIAANPAASDYNEEMHWYAKLPLDAPRAETFARLLPVLNALIPYVANEKYRDWGREAVIECLAQRAAENPREAIRLLRRLQEKAVQPYWPPDETETRAILEAGAADPDARPETLALIDLFGKLGDDRFRDIYDKYA